MSTVVLCCVCQLEDELSHCHKLNLCRCIETACDELTKLWDTCFVGSLYRQSVANNAAWSSIAVYMT